MYWTSVNTCVLNTVERPDRYAHIVKELYSLNIVDYKIFSFPANREDPEHGIYENVIHILQSNINEKKPILIIEDDAVALENASANSDVFEFIKNTNQNDWDMIRLGYNKPIYIDQIPGYKSLYRGNCVYTTATIYSYPFAKRLIDTTLKPKKYEHIDWYLARITGRTILPLNTLFIQGYHGSDNIWSSNSNNLMDEMLNNPKSYHTKYINIGHSYIDSLLPRMVVYYVLLAKYHSIFDIIGFKAKIKYEINSICHI